MRERKCSALLPYSYITFYEHEFCRLTWQDIHRREGFRELWGYSWFPIKILSRGWEANEREHCHGGSTHSVFCIFNLNLPPPSLSLTLSLSLLSFTSKKRYLIFIYRMRSIRRRIAAKISKSKRTIIKVDSVW